MEEWKTFSGYEISNFGNCRRKNKIINGSINNRGYRYFQLQRDGKRINYLFHHLVALLFISERPDGFVIDHIDRDKLNNHVSNLRYTTQQINCQNQEKYRSDIETNIKHERKRIFQQEYAIRSGRKRGIRREKNSGSISQRNNSFRATITLNNVRYSKTFKTKDEAEQYLIEVKQIK